MAARIKDHWVWLGVGLFFLAAAKAIQYAIDDVNTLTELDKIDGEDDKDERLEDTISLSTLRSLASHPNPQIASSAQSLIVTRFASSENAADLLTTDLSSEDEVVRRKAKQAIAYLQEWDTQLNGADPLVEEYGQAVGETERLLIETGEPSRALGLMLDGRPFTRLEDLRPTVDSPRGATEGFNRDLRSLDEQELEERFGEARFAGWERIPAQRPVAGEREDERRRRRREAMVVSDGDDQWIMS